MKFVSYTAEKIVEALLFKLLKMIEAVPLILPLSAGAALVCPVLCCMGYHLQTECILVGFYNESSFFILNDFWPVSLFFFNGTFIIYAELPLQNIFSPADFLS